MQLSWHSVRTVLAFVACMLLSAADVNSSSAEDLRVGIVNASTDVPFFIADAKGYFRDEGLNVELLAFDAGAKMVASLGIGELAVGAGAPSVALYNAAARGVHIKIVADKGHHAAGKGHAALLVRKDLVASGKFKGYADLKGLKVAIVGVGSSDESVLNEALKRGGLKWGDATPVYMGFPNHPAAFKNAAVDASLTSEPFVTFILNAGTAVRFARNGEIYPDQQSTTVMYSRVFIENKPEAARKFMRAYIRAARFYNDAIVNDSLTGRTAPEVIDLLTKYTALKDANFFRTTIPPAIDPNGKLNLESMHKDWQFFKDSGQIDGRVRVEDLIDLSFAEAALASLGPYAPHREK